MEKRSAAATVQTVCMCGLLSGACIVKCFIASHVLSHISVKRGRIITSLTRREGTMNRCRLCKLVGYGSYVLIDGEYICVRCAAKEIGRLRAELFENIEQLRDCRKLLRLACDNINETTPFA